MEKLNENVKIDQFVLMPNHVHGIVVLENEKELDRKEQVFGFEITERRGRRSLQGLVKDFKSVTTRIYKKQTKGASSLWQSSFYDEVIRNKEQYEKICRYIAENPEKWLDDELYKE